MCKTSNVRESTEALTIDAVLKSNTDKTVSNSWNITLQLNNIYVIFKVVTGAECNIISHADVLKC